MTRFAQALSRRIDKKANHHQRVFHGQIVRVGPPMKVELYFHERVLVEEDDFHLTHAMQIFRNEFDLSVGDTTLLMHERQEWSLFDIHTDAESPKLADSKSHKALAKQTTDSEEALSAQIASLAGRVTALGG